MADWFKTIEASCELSAEVAQALDEVGFVVIPGPVATARLAQFVEAYEAAVAGAFLIR